MSGLSPLDGRYALPVALACWSLGGLAAWLLRRRAAGGPAGVAGAIGGGVFAAVAAVRALSDPGTPASATTWHVAWRVPIGAVALRLDPIAAVFLLPVAVVGALCAVYGLAYLRRGGSTRAIGGSFAAFNLLLLGMAVVVTADDLVLLLVAWELMTLSSWALVVSEHREPAVRAAGVQYLVAGHLATAALLLLVLCWSATNGGSAVAALRDGPPIARGSLFLLALAGFGTKAGIVPMHVWLPDAHPAAPSHVSALMSAVMITMGFYGIVRFIPLLGAPPVWWGMLLMLLGAAGAVGGVVFAFAQRDVKRVLAYSTVENAGIITLAIGLGLVGTSLGHPALAGFAWTAALLHLWNHAAAKSLLFLGFGAVAQGAGTRRLDALGGVMRRWRVTGSFIILGAAAIASLPGLNVFASEWLLLRGLFAGALVLTGAAQVALLAAVSALAFAGAVALACFAGLVGLGLLGTSRSPAAAQAPRPVRAMTLPIAVLGALCVALALVPAQTSAALGSAVRVIAPAADASGAPLALAPVGLLLPLLAGIVALVLAGRWLVATRPAVRESAAPERQLSTWGCGYPRPTSAMQYTSASFGGALTRIMDPLLRTRIAGGAARGGSSARWPGAASWTSSTADRILAGIYQPVFARVARTGAWLRGLHDPRVTTSLLYVLATVLVLLALFFAPGAIR